MVVESIITPLGAIAMPFDHFASQIQVDEVSFDGWDTCSPEELHEMNTWLDDVEGENNDRDDRGMGLAVPTWAFVETDCPF